MPVVHTRVAIIGCGNVGLACAHSLLLNRLAREIVLISHDSDHTRGEALDLQQAVPLGSPVSVTAGTYEDAAASHLVVLAVGGAAKFATTRLALLAENAVIVRECLRKLREAGFKGVLVIATNPVDVIVRIAHRESGLEPCQIIGSGTLLDSERLRNLLGRHFEVDPRSVHAAVIGEHGDSSVAVWSSAQIAGIPLAHYKGFETLSLPDMLTAVRQAGPEVAHLKGNTCYAIAACVTRIAEAVLRDEGSALLVSTMLTGQYGMTDIAMSTPCIVGAGGIERALALELALEEKAALEASAAVLRHAYDSLESAATNA